MTTSSTDFSVLTQMSVDLVGFVILVSVGTIRDHLSLNIKLNKALIYCKVNEVIPIVTTSRLFLDVFLQQLAKT